MHSEKKAGTMWENSYCAGQVIIRSSRKRTKCHLIRSGCTGCYPNCNMTLWKKILFLYQLTVLSNVTFKKSKQIRVTQGYSKIEISRCIPTTCNLFCSQDLFFSHCQSNMMESHVRLQFLVSAKCCSSSIHQQLA